MVSRRGFLTGLGAALAAPGLMPEWYVNRFGYWAHVRDGVALTSMEHPHLSALAYSFKMTKEIVAANVMRREHEHAD